jgi:hypothetical protein
MSDAVPATNVEIKFATTHGLDGTLTICADAMPDIIIADELWHHLMHLCGALPELCQGRAVGIPFASMPGGYELSRQGRAVAINGDHLAVVTYDLLPFASALLDAANRWLSISDADPAREGVAPAVRDAMETGRDAIAAIPSQEANAIADFESADLETVYDALITVGKKGRRELRSRVEAFLTHPEPALREAALKVLAFYWRLPEHTATAIRALREDGDRDVRGAAAMALGAYEVGDSDILRLLLDVALDAMEEESVRDAAHSSALIAAGVSKTDYPMERTLPGFEASANWRLLARLLGQLGVPIPKRLEELSNRSPDEAP